MKIDISQLDEAQLLALNQQIVARLKYLQEARTHRQMMSFKVGDRVSFRIGEVLFPEQARLQARQLVADTFERIVIYHRGVRPGPEGKGPMDMMLLAKGGQARLLRIDRQGKLLVAETVGESAPQKQKKPSTR